MSWLRKTKSSSRRCSRFSSELDSRLSTQITRYPLPSRYSQRWEPRKPAPPVTTAVGTRPSYRRFWLDPAPRAEELADPPPPLFRRFLPPLCVGGDPDPELVASAAASDVAVVGGQREVVAGDAVHRAGAAVLRLDARDDQHRVDVAVEVEVPDLELELGLALRRAAVLRVLRVEAEVGASAERRVRRVRAGLDVDPAAARDEAGRRVVDDDFPVDRGRGAVVVRDGDVVGVDACARVDVARRAGA